MSYYLDTYELPIYFISGLIVLFLLLAAFIPMAHFAAKHWRLKEKAGNTLTGVAVFSAAITFFLALYNIPDYLNDGQIEHMYIVEKNGDERVVVWFVRVDEPAGMTTAYSHRLKSFDLDTGGQCGRLTLSRRYLFNDYHIYGPFNEFAWGYTGQKGMTFLDVFEPEAIAEQQDILRRNPMLGDQVRLWTGKNATRFDAVTFGLYVYTAGGDIYRINPDLKATPIDAIDRHLKHDKQTCAVCRQKARFINMGEGRSGWVYDATSKYVLRFRNEEGKILNTIDLHETFGDNTYLYAAARVKEDIWLFVTMKRYYLSALRTDAKTGRILGKVKYF